jgi:hypothetical protein|tara:strand:- start:1052 stop:1372 length:321 start_codon:yes stop_codon:yes gene_type:complete
MDWDNFPLTSMEAYIFADVGAWRSFEELENELTLQELLLIVNSCRRSDYKNLKIMAMSQGAEVELDDDDYGFEIFAGAGKDPISGFEASHLPIGLGYTAEDQSSDN